MAIDGGNEAAAHIVRCLQTCLYAVDGNSRKAAEQQLEAGVHHPGFSSTLASLATDGALTNNDVGLRQLAAVLLKQVIKNHWSAEARKFEEPELSRDERAHIQTVLPSGLSDASSKVRTAVAMCIAAISKTDPDGWPGLVENLVGAIHSQRASNTPLVHGAIRCLSLLSDDIDEQQLPQVARALLPELLHVAADAGGAPEELRAAAMSIFYDVLKSLGVMTGVYQKQVRDLLVPLVDPWLPLLCGVVAQPINVQDTSGWSVRMLALKSLTQLCSYFARSLAGGHMQAVMGVSWGMFTGSLGTYTMNLVLSPAEGGQAGDEGEGAGGGGEVDSEGNTLDLESMLAQLFELLMALVGRQRYAKLIKPALPEMSYLVVAYMQMTASQASEWLDNPSQYVADEEDNTFTVRVSGELLIDSLLQMFDLDAAGALMDAVERRMQEAAAARAAGQAGWWKLREAALLAAGCVVASFPGGLGGSGGGGGGRLGGGGGGGSARQRAAVGSLQCRLQGLMDEVLRNDLQGPSINPLLVGRAMWLADRLQPSLRPDQRPQLLAAAAAGLNSGLPPPVKIGACRALSSLAPRVSPDVLGPLADQLYGGLLGLLGGCGEEALNLVLECMVPLIKADPSAAARALPALSTPLLQIWSRYVTDPLVAESSLEVLGALARVPDCLGPLAQQVLPVLAQVIRNPAGQPPGLVEGCLDLLPKLLRPGRVEVVAAVAASCTGPLLALLPGGAAAGADDDTGALTHGATEVLVELLRAGGEDVLSRAAPSMPQPASAAAPSPAAAVTLPPPSSSASHPPTGPSPSPSPSPMSTSPTGPPSASAPSSATPSPAPPPPPTSTSSSPDSVFAALLSTTLRMLDPSTDEYRTCLVGDLAAALVRCLPARAARQPALGALLAGCAAKLAASNLAPLVGGLLAALGHMVLAGGAAGWLEALGAMRVQPPDGGSPVSGVQAVLPVLLERYGDVRGGLASRVVALAMCELLQTRHPLLMSVTVRGKRHDLGTGVRTRRQAAAGGGEAWSSVLAAVRCAAVVAELAVEQPWVVEEAREEEAGSEEEEDEYDDDDDDDEYEDDEEEEDGDDADEELEDGDAMGGGGDGPPAASGPDLSLSGKGINRREQASLDAHIDRSPMLPADSALLAPHGYANTNGGAGTVHPTASAAAAAPDAAMVSSAASPRQTPDSRLLPPHLSALAAADLRSALLAALAPLQQQPDGAAFLGAALELLPTKKQQQALQLMATAATAAATAAAAGGLGGGGVASGGAGA